MPFLAKMISFWNNLFRRKRVERDLNDELQAYVEEMAERKIQAGLAPEAAREATLLELGGIERIEDLVRQQRIGFGNLRRAGLTAIVAFVAFVSGASAAVGVMRWNALPTEKSVAATPVTKRTPKQPPSPVLQGRVVDKATGDPVPYVEVGLQEVAPFRLYTFTDDEGRFAFNNPPSRGYRLETGNERWFISGSMPLFDRFTINKPTDVRVKDNNGQLLEGERPNMQRPVYFKNAKARDSWEKRQEALEGRRNFHYSDGTIELPVTNLPPGRESALAFGAPKK